MGDSEPHREHGNEHGGGLKVKGEDHYRWFPSGSDASVQLLLQR